MNNSLFDFANNFPLFLSANSGPSSLPSSIQNMTAIMLQNIYKEAQKQALFDLVYGHTELSFPKPSVSLKPMTMTTSINSYNSMENLKSSTEGGSQLFVKEHVKKPIFTITRQTKQHSNAVVSEEPVEDPKKPCIANYNRKEKSLGELSKRFLTMFGRVDDCVISLDTLTKQLDVERRRVYDIINILESLGVVYRKGKNNYQWSGFQPIRQTIAKLEMKGDIKHEEESEESSPDDDVVGKRLANKKEKSLAYLAGSFIKLFFSWKETFPLEEAAYKLSTNETDEHKLKTKVRRLYDIANVFSSLGLIRKICLDSKKPAFKWIGNPGLDEFIRKLNTSTTIKQTVCAEKVAKKKVIKAPPQITTEEPSRLNIPLDSSTSQNLKQEIADNLLNVLLEVRQKQGQTGNFSHPHPFAGLGEHSGLSTPTHNFQINGFGNRAPMETEFDVLPIQRSTIMERRRIEQIQKNVGSLNVKRPLAQNFNGYEIKTVKKVHPSVQTSSEKTIFRSINLSSMENFSMQN